MSSEIKHPSKGFQYKYVLGPNSPLTVNLNPETWVQHVDMAINQGLNPSTAMGGYTKYDGNNYIFTNRGSVTLKKEVTKVNFDAALAIGIVTIFC